MLDTCPNPCVGAFHEAAWQSEDQATQIASSVPHPVWSSVRSMTSWNRFSISPDITKSFASWSIQEIGRNDGT